MSIAVPKYAKGKAITAGAVAGIGSSALIALPFFGLAGSTPFYTEQGLSPVIIALTAAPGVIIIAAIFAFPASALLVWLMNLGARRAKLFDQCITWVTSGCALSFPAAWLFGQFQSPNRPFELNHGSLFILGVAAFSALVAWLFRKSAVS